MTEFQELVKDAPKFASMERGELAVYAYALYAAGAKMDAENAKLKADTERMFQANVEKNNEILGLLAENAKLRELVALWIVINKHMSLCATTVCEQCPVREECGESVYLEGLLGIDPKGLSWRVQDRMRELGVEVDE